MLPRLATGNTRGRRAYILPMLGVGVDGLSGLRISDDWGRDIVNCMASNMMAASSSSISCFTSSLSSLLTGRATWTRRFQWPLIGWEVESVRKQMRVHG